MAGNRGGTRAARGHRLLTSKTEKQLRKHHALAADDHLIELKVGKIEQWVVAGSRQPLPPLHGKPDIPALRGLASCSYSSQRLFFGTTGTVSAALDSVWRTESRGRLLRVVFSGPGLTSVVWRFMEIADDAELTRFAERIMLQRDRALATLPPESRQQAASHLAVLQRSGLLMAALTGREARTPPDASVPPRTYVGRWLRAAMLDQREMRDRLARTLNGGASGWNEDEPVVVQAASELLATGYFGPVPDEDEIVRVAELVSQATADEKQPMDKQTAQAVIRSSLGWAPAVEVTRGQGFLAATLLLGLLSLLLNLDQPTVDTLLSEAERMAFERGAHPPVDPRERLPT